MAELELVRVEEDGGSLILRGPDGTRYVLPVTDALRAAVRPVPEVSVYDDVAAGPPAPAAAPAAGSADDDDEPALRPRDLQARLRAGATAEELAPLARMTVEQVRRYEWPVTAEREHVIGKVRTHEVPGLTGTSELGEVADARLAARGVPASDAVWSARRQGSAPWVVEVRFAAGDRERSARWTFDPRARVVTPLDDEARWLGQPDDPLTPEVRGVPSIPVRRVPPPTDPETDLLLDDLRSRRGTRAARRPGAPATGSFPAAHPAGSGRAAGDDEPASGAFPVLPLGDLPAREPTPLRSAGPSAVGSTTRAGDAAKTAKTADADDTGGGGPDRPGDDAGEHGTNVVDFGRWNPRRSRDKSVSPGAGPGASQPALLPVNEAPAPPSAHATGPATGSMPRAGAADDAPGTDSPETPGRGVPAGRRSRKNRAPVPSWDEIVFGSRPDQA